MPVTAFRRLRRSDPHSEPCYCEVDIITRRALPSSRPFESTQFLGDIFQ